MSRFLPFQPHLNIFLPAWHFFTLLYISACILRPHFASPRVSGSVHTELCNNNANIYTSNSYNKGNNNWRNKRYKCQLQQYAVVVLILKNKCALSLFKKNFAYVYHACCLSLNFLSATILPINVFNVH